MSQKQERCPKESLENPLNSEVNSDKTLLFHSQTQFNSVNYSKRDPTQEPRLHLVVMPCQSPSIWNSSSALSCLSFLDSLKEYRPFLLQDTLNLDVSSRASQAVHFWQEGHSSNAVHSIEPYLLGHTGQPVPATGDFNLAHVSVQFLSDFFTIFTQNRVNIFPFLFDYLYLNFLIEVQLLHSTM